MKTCNNQSRRVASAVRHPLAQWLAASVAAFVLLADPVCTAAYAATALNLSSTAHSVSAPTAATINVGGKSVAVQSGAMITPAELVAVDQILQSGRQQLVIGQNGNAVGGMFSVNGVGGSLSSITIPHGVTALDNFTNSNLTLTGDYTNAGRFYAYSTSSASPSASIQALDLINQRGGLISSSLPSGNFGLSNVIPSLDLNLAAASNFINHGSIVSSGNINIASLNSNNLTINNTGGSIKALGQSINIDNTQFSQNSNVNLIGGNWLSNQLNVNSGNGSIFIDVGKITGVVNTQAGSVFTQASTPNLQIGSVDVSGDPTFYNTNGSISITSALTFAGQDLALVASGNISSPSFGVASISTSNNNPLTNSGNGGNIVIIAGAKFTVPAGGQGFNLPPGPGDTTTTLKITGGSSTGGVINLTGFTALDSSSKVPSGNGNGGNITLVAFAGSGTGSGSITVPASLPVNTAGFGAGTNGNVLMIGGANTGNAVSVGAITASGATTTGGNIGLFAAKPVLTNTSILNGTLTGTISAGAVTGGGIAFVDSISPVNVAGGGTFTATAGGAIDTSKANITSAGNLAIKSTGGAITAGSITSTAGDVSLIAGGVVAQSSNGLILTKPITASGNITLLTTGKNGNILVDGNVVSTNNGSITANANGTGSIEMLNQVTTKIGLGGTIGSQFPVGAAPTPDGQFVFVPDYQNNSIYILSTATDTKIGTFTDPSLSKPQGTAIAPGGGTLYVANYGSQTITVITYNPVTGAATLSKTLAIPASAGTPEALAVSPDGKTLYVVSDKGLALGNAGFVTPSPESFTTVDVASGTTQTISLGTNLEQSGGVVLNPTGTTAWVTNSGSKAVSVIHLTTATPSVTKTIDLSSFGASNPISLAIDPNGTRIYVSEASLVRLSNAPHAFITGQVAIIDALSSSKTFDQVVSSVPFANGSFDFGGTFPQGITTSATGVEVFTQTTYGVPSLPQQQALPNTIAIYANSSPQASVGIFTGTGTDGIGSSNWSSVITTPAAPGRNAISNLATFTSDTYNFSTNPATVSVVTEPTMQAKNVSLTSGGFILGSYDALGGTLNVNAAGKNSQVILSNVGASESSIGNSKSTGLFEIGSLQTLDLTGSILSPKVMIQATAANSNINIGTTLNAAKVGQPGASVLISTNGTGAITQGNALSSVIGATVTFNTAGGDVGANGTNKSINTSTANIAVDGAGNAFVNNTGAVSISPSTVTTLFSLASSGSITFPSTSSISASNVSLTATNGSIFINAALGQGALSNVSLTTGGSGAIVQASGNFDISAGDVSLIGAKGNIGSTSSPIRTTASILDVNTGGQAFISNTGNITVNEKFTGSAFSLTNAGAITIADNIAAKSVTLNAVGSASSTITLGTAVVVGQAGAADTITAAGTINGPAGTTISGKSLLIASLGGDITANTDANTVNVYANGTNVSITDSSTGTVTLNGAAAPSSAANASSTSPTPPVVNFLSFGLTATGSLVSNLAMSGASDSLTATNGTAIINKPMTGSTTSVIAGGNITTNAGVVGSTTILDAGAGGHNGGIMISPKVVDGNGNIGGTTATLTAHGTGTIMNTNSSGVISDQINATSESGSIGGKVPFLFITLNLSAHTTTGSANLLDVGSGVALGLSGSIGGSATLNTRGSSLNIGTLSVGPDIASTTDVKAGHNLTIIQDGGSSSGTGGVTISGALTVTNGNITINQLGSGGLSTTATGIVSTQGTTKSAIGGNISLVNQGAGALDIVGNVTSTNGNIVLREANPSTGSITLGSTVIASPPSTTIRTTGGGTITVAIGKVPVVPQNGGQNKFPTGTTVTGTKGNAFAGSTPSAIVNGPATPATVLNVTGANILFNSPTALRTITFGDNLTLTTVSAKTLEGDDSLVVDSDQDSQ